MWDHRWIPCSPALPLMRQGLSKGPFAHNTGEQFIFLIIHREHRQENMWIWVCAIHIIFLNLWERNATMKGELCKFKTHLIFGKRVCVCVYVHVCLCVHLCCVCANFMCPISFGSWKPEGWWTICWFLSLQLSFLETIYSLCSLAKSIFFHDSPFNPHSWESK